MNNPWIDPREIDWQDGLNPLRIPAFRRNRNRYVYTALQNPLMVALRNADGLEIHLESVPDAEHATIAGFAPYEQIVSLRPGSFIIATSGSADHGNDTATVQITDSETGARAWSQPVSIANATGSPAKYFDRPLGFTPPANFVVRITNLDNSANLVQLVLWIIRPSL